MKCLLALVFLLCLNPLLVAQDSLIVSKDTLLVGYNIVPPFVTEIDGQAIGPSVWLWEQIAEDNNLVFKYQRMGLDRLLSGLQSHELDICISPLTITSDRSRFLDFSAPYYIAHASLLQREVSTFNKSLAFISSFFSVNFFRALGALAFVILSFGVLLWFFERKHNEEEFGRGLAGIWEGFWWSAVTMTTVGYGDKSPRSFGGRVVALIWMFTAIIIISGFTAGIASSLTVDRMDASSGSIEDFKSKQLGTIKNSATEDWLAHNFFINKRSYKDMQGLLKALDEGKIDAVAYDRPTLSTIIANDSTDHYKLAALKYNPQFYALGMSKVLSDSLKDQINISMLDNIEQMDWAVLLSENNLR